VGPTKTFGPADRKNVKDVQKALGYSGSDADGYPGPVTLAFLFGPDMEIKRQTTAPTKKE
jgi:hypothetical protein